MFSRTKTPEGNTGKSAANTDIEKKEKNEAAYQNNDNRAEAITQRQVQDMADGSDQVSQLRTIQLMTDASSRVQQAVQRQAMSGAVLQRYPPRGFKVNSHFKDRMEERGISKATVDDVVLNGNRYSDTEMPGATIYYKDGTAIIYDGSQLKTCYEGRVKTRWQPK